MKTNDPVTLPPPRLEHLFDVAVAVGPAVEVGATPQGLRRVVPIVGGTVRGAAVAGRVLAIGADYQLVVGGTTALLDARYVIELDDGARLYVHNRALRHADADDSLRLMRGEPVPAERVYFRCQPRFETAAPQWAWLQDCQFVGSGVRDPDQVRISFYRVC